MTDPLESRLRRAADSLDAAAHRWQPDVSEGSPPSGRPRRWLVTTAAAVTLVAGLVAVAIISGDDEEARSPAATAPAGTEAPETGPTASATTALPTPMTDPNESTGPAHDELTRALERLGIDIETAPAAVTHLDGALFCGVSTWILPSVSRFEPSEPARCIAQYQRGPDALVFVLKAIDRNGTEITVWRTIPGQGVRSYTRSEDGAEWSTSACKLVFFQPGRSTGGGQFGCDEDGVPELTTTTVPAEPNQLEVALAALGVDVEHAPPGATRLDGEFCGVATWDPELFQPRWEVPATCFLERTAAGEPVVAVAEFSTPEGSPVITIFSARPGERVVVYTDSTRDDVWGSGEWSTHKCSETRVVAGRLECRG